MNYWLLKTEPGCFSIHDLAACPAQTTGWDGVRNYQARNFMRDQMRRGDRVLIYHSSVDPPVVAGTARIVREAYADHTALDAREQHYDPKASRENPIWCMVDVQLEKIFRQPVPLEALRGLPELKAMELLRKGSRLSVQPVREPEFAAVLALADRDTASATVPAKKTSRAALSKQATPKKSTARKTVVASRGGRK